MGQRRRRAPGRAGSRCRRLAFVPVLLGVAVAATLLWQVAAARDRAATPAAAELSGRRQADPLESAKSHIRLKEFSAAQAELRRLSDAGNAHAQYLLGVFYLDGIAGPRDPALARVWLEKAADRGEGAAAYSLAILSQDTQRDDAEAQRWLARARQLGFEPPPAVDGGEASILTGGLSGYSNEPQSAAEALWLAAARGDMAALRHFATPATVKARDAFGRGALDRAAENAHPEAVQLLLQTGAAADESDLDGITALMLAAASGSSPSVTMLLKAGADPNAADHSHDTVLMYAARADRPELIEQLLHAGAKVSARNLQDWSALDFAENQHLVQAAARLRAAGATALHHNSVSSGELSVVQHARPPQPDLYAGWPDLVVAASLHTTSVLESLLQHGADPNATAGQEPALTVAALVGRPAAVDDLLAAHADPARADHWGDSALQAAIRAGREDSVQALLSHGLPPDERSKATAPPLVTAARYGHVAIVRELLAAHAHVDWQDGQGQNALMVAARSGDAGMLRELLGAHPTLELEDKSGHTALWYAAQSGSLEKTHMLVAQGAQVDHADSLGLDPLQVACAGGHVAVVDYLLKQGARTDARSKSGDTPLHIAVSSARAAPSVEALLAAHAQLDVQNAFGDTALIVASRRGDARIVKRLLAAGASSLLRNHDKLTAADVAEARSFHAVAALLNGS